MRSGNGRHRRPRQAPAIFVTAGVTGAGLALPLLSAGGAHAADAATWDRVAQCESGGMWSSATGNGFYGGLQLTQEMWDHYGGSAYASRPDLASRAQQIAVAQAILDDRGPDAFPSCAVDAGLTKGGRKPGVDPGSTSRPTPRPTHDPSADDPATGDPSGTSGDADRAGPGAPTPTPSDSDTDPGAGSDSGTPGAPSASQDPTDPTGTTGPTSPTDSASPSDSPSPSSSEKPTGGPTGEPSGSPSGTPSADPSDATPSTPGAPSPSSPPSTSPSDPTDPGAPPAAGKHRGVPGDGAGSGDERDGGSGRHASRGGAAHRTPPAGAGDYRVRPGDNLSAIAERHDLPGGWPALYDRNRGVIGSDADLILPGQLLDLGRTQG